MKPLAVSIGQDQMAGMGLPGQGTKNNIEQFTKIIK